MKTAELQGAALDLAVARAMGRKPNDFGWWWDNFKPSTNWAQGGPIIELEGITTAPYSTHNGVIKEWKAGRDWPMSHFPYYLGPTPLVAAMRCYVASKMGDTVDIPEELT